MKKPSTHCSKAFQEASGRKAQFGKEEKKLLDALQQFADEVNDEGIFSAVIVAGIARGGNYVALKLQYLETRCSETFYADFAQCGGYRSLRFLTGATRQSLSGSWEGSKRAGSGYCIQFSTDREALSRALGEHMAGKVTAQKMAKAAALYVVDKKK